MRVILARRTVGGSRLGGPPEVHAYRDHGAVWVAACGEQTRPADVEVVAAGTGAPCMTCMMIGVAASNAEPIPRAEVETPAPRELERAPADAAPEGGCAVSWRGKLVHLVAADAPRTRLDGHPLVLGLCGALGWGPHTSAPAGYAVCAECDQISGART